MYARGSFADTKSIDAHVALANDSFGRAVAGNIVWAREHAVLAADALVIEMLNDASFGILFICIDRAAVHTSRLEAVMTCRGNMLYDRVEFVAASQQANVSPDFTFIEPVQIVACCDTCLTATTGI